MLFRPLEFSKTNAARTCHWRLKIQGPAGRDIFPRSRAITYAANADAYGKAPCRHDEQAPVGSPDEEGCRWEKEEKR